MLWLSMSSFLKIKPSDHEEFSFTNNYDCTFFWCKSEELAAVENWQLEIIYP